MIPSRAALAAAAERSAPIARAWHDGDAVRHATAAFAALAPDDADRVADAAATLLADAAWIAALLAPLAAALREDPWFDAPLRVARDTRRTVVRLLDLPAATVSATVAVGDPDAATLTVPGRLAVTRYHRARGARLLRWDAGPPDAAYALPLAALPVIDLHDGLVLRTDGRREAMLIDAAAPVATVTVATRAPVMVREYERATGRLLRIATGDEAASRTHMLLTLLRIAGRTDAGDRFDAATRADAFHLRWEAMREWLALDADAALPRLRELAAGDPHGEVRATAAATLARIGSAPCPA
ncbi:MULTISPECIES: hypothetical protein [Sphingomonas]|uniref:HEAT repeat domain-containing protein n=1 Tax=Sphingomonas adhaesiva TaxID=28212 RepID=A0A2A4IA16_9SPHN|nr:MULTISPECIES: hypothetical protein [Sphingomonas]PCG14844.1 hypothetical protein COA07_04460 [Sphingomonas adhaesiva]PZU78528.1 MAG: hypothetical protein DI530_10450 [Sphingomonas sp.]